MKTFGYGQCSARNHHNAVGHFLTHGVTPHVAHHCKNRTILKHWDTQTDERKCPLSKAKAEIQNHFPHEHSQYLQKTGQKGRGQYSLMQWTQGTASQGGTEVVRTFENWLWASNFLCQLHVRQRQVTEVEVTQTTTR